MRTWTKAVLVVVFVAAISGAAIVVVQKPQLPQPCKGVETFSPLTDSVAEQTLSKDYQNVYKFRSIPDSVKHSISVINGGEVAMVDPGEEMSTDAILPGVPNNRLIFAGIRNDAAMVIFEHGAFVGSLHAVVISCSGTPSEWAAIIKDRDVKDIPSLQRAIAAHRYTAWKDLTRPVLPSIPR